MFSWKGLLFSVCGHWGSFAWVRVHDCATLCLAFLVLILILIDTLPILLSSVIGFNCWYTFGVHGVGGIRRVTGKEGASYS